MERYLPLAKELKYEVFTFKYEEDDITRYEAKKLFLQRLRRNRRRSYRNHAHTYSF